MLDDQKRAILLKLLFLPRLSPGCLEYVIRPAVVQKQTCRGSREIELHLYVPHHYYLVVLCDDRGEYSEPVVIETDTFLALAFVVVILKNAGRIDRLNM